MLNFLLEFNKNNEKGKATMIEKDGYIYETPEDNLFINEVNGMRLKRRFIKSDKTYRELIREYTEIILNKELGDKI